MIGFLIFASLAIGLPLTMLTIVYVEARGWRSLWRKLWEYGSVGVIIIAGLLAFIGWCDLALHGY